MSDENPASSQLTRLRQVGLGLGLSLAEQRQEAGEVSPGSRFGPLGRSLKWFVRRLIRFHTLRQSEFNLGVTRALREAESALRELTQQLGDSQLEVRELRDALGQEAEARDRRLAELGEVLASVEHEGVRRAETLEVTLAGHLQQIEKQARELAEQALRSEGLGRRVAGLRESLSDLQRSRSKRAKVVERRIATFEEALERVERATLQQAEDLERNLAAHDSQLEKQVERITGHERRSGELEAQLGHFREALARLERGSSERSEELTSALVAQMQRIDEQGQQAEGLAARSAEVEQQLERLSEGWPQRAELLESSMQAHGSQLDELTEQVLQATRDLEGLQGETLALGAKFPQLEEDLRGQVEGSVEQLEGSWARHSEQLETSFDTHENRLDQLQEQVVVTSTGLQTLQQESHDLGARLPAVAQELGASLVRIEQSQGEAQQRMAQLEESARDEVIRVGDLSGAIEAVTADLKRLERVAGEQELQLPELARDVRRRLGDMEEFLRPTLSFDYLDFERQFRGDENEIKERMRGYAQRFGSVERVLDAGCGRGEFLELCRELETGAYGVDTDAGMVSRCRVKGLAVVQGDVLTHLAELEECSLDGIFSAQVVEHLLPAELLRFLRLAAAKLRRGGLIILETINPDTYSALRTFYADVTHRQPLPNRTLAFLLEDAGFTVRETLFSSHLPEEQKLAPLEAKSAKGRPPALEARLIRRYNENCARLNEILFGPQDYAIIAEL